MSNKATKPSLRIVTDPALTVISTPRPPPCHHNGRLRPRDVYPNTVAPRPSAIHIFNPPSPAVDALYDSDATVLDSPSYPTKSTKILDSPDSPYTISGFGEIPLSNACFIPTSNPDHAQSSHPTKLLHLRVGKPPMPKRRHRVAVRDKSPRALWRSHIYAPPLSSPSTPTSPLSPRSDFRSLVDSLRSTRNLPSSIRLNLAPVDAPTRLVHVFVNGPTTGGRLATGGMDQSRCLPSKLKPPAGGRQPKRPPIPKWDS